MSLGVTVKLIETDALFSFPYFRMPVNRGPLQQLEKRTRAFEMISFQTLRHFGTGPSGTPTTFHIECPHPHPSAPPARDSATTKRMRDYIPLQNPTFISQHMEVQNVNGGCFAFVARDVTNHYAGNKRHGL